jgi:hypothetical protein
MKADDNIFKLKDLVTQICQAVVLRVLVEVSRVDRFNRPSPIAAESPERIQTD